jgi:hypothetical protein
MEEGALGLGSPIDVGWDIDFAHGIGFDARLCIARVGGGGAILMICKGSHDEISWAPERRERMRFGEE